VAKSPIPTDTSFEKPEGNKVVKMVRKNARYETSIGEIDQFDLYEPEIIKDSIINEVQTMAGSKEEHYDSV
jgi:hypothetical protein